MWILLGILFVLAVLFWIGLTAHPPKTMKEVIREESDSTKKGRRNPHSRPDTSAQEYNSPYGRAERNPAPKPDSPTSPEEMGPQ